MDTKKVMSKLGLCLISILVTGLLVLSPVMADGPVVPEANAEITVTPNPGYNDGTQVINFLWDFHDWVGTASHFSMELDKFGSNVPILIHYSDDAGTDNFTGMGPLEDIAGTVGGPGVHLHNPEFPGYHTWTVPAGFPPGTYTAFVKLYVDDHVEPEAAAFVTITILQATGTLEIIKEDGGGQPLSGWHFNVTGPTHLSGDTGAGGNLTFTNIPDGLYTVTETPKAGWANTVPGDYDADVNVPFEGTGTVTFVNVEDIGNLHIFKFNDLDGDGNYEPGNGETGLDGWHFTVNPGNMQGDTSGGGYLNFDNIDAGNYNITETLKPGWTNTTPKTRFNIAVNLGQTTTVEFGNWEAGNIDIFKYYDVDGEGEGYSPGDGDYALSGWHFKVDGAGDYITDGTGHITVLDLTPGNHTVAERTPLPYGWFNTDPGDYSEQVNVPSGDTASVDFGNEEREIIVPTLTQWGIIALAGLLGLAVAATIAWRMRLPKQA